MANIFDVAKYILEQKGQMSTWKLQKLCFYSQAWFLVWEGKPLFPEEFEAWMGGPVCRQLWQEHRGRFMIKSQDLRYGDSRNLSALEREDIGIVLRDYGNMEPYELREQTHAEAPWKNARGNLPWDASSNVVISKESIGEYYGSL